ncbi:hypothetical protein [Egicoccus halophilus]|uniref:Uncharacterized protein n=1 Tax=Egicoccus halophilus TaxID=1670830 RepID=A0A8J3EWZ8_9ACTN|nr:hypothetical protein [Egicoccus halophilus]GGI04753.1 hypothetical protein GCM10011354_10670 [Egicoccus halophilus]
MKVLAAVVGPLLAVLLVVGVLGGHGSPAADPSPAAFEGPVQAEAGSDAALLAALAALDASLPTDSAPSGVVLDVERTWGRLEGEVVDTARQLDAVEGELRRLFVAADAGGTPVADAVGEVARGWLDLRGGLAPLVRWEQHDLARPLDADDADGVAIGADEVRGLAETGIEQLLRGQRRLHDGYTALRAAGAADPQAQARLDLRAADAEAFDRNLRPRLLRLLSADSATVLVTTERFTTPGNDARARAGTVVCVDRDAMASPDTVPGTTASVDAGRAQGRVDCPAALPAP